MTRFALPQSDYITVTPELVCRILDDGHLHPGHQEGDIAFAVNTQEFADFMRRLGFEVVVGYQQWGSNAACGDYPAPCNHDPAHVRRNEG